MSPLPKPAADLLQRAVIEGVQPEIDCGRFPIKRTIGETVTVEADAFTDGHDAIACTLLYRRRGDPHWSATPMAPLVNDRWRGEFTVAEQGRYEYTLSARIDRFGTWVRDLRKRLEAGQNVDVELLVGAALLEDSAGRADPAAADKLRGLAHNLRHAGDVRDKIALVLQDEIADLAARYADETGATRYPRELGVVVDRERARFGAWYELFPRSTGKPGTHGTFRTCIERLPYIAAMGFDVVYLPPIHPIGVTHRKGPNNALTANPGDPGSPWAIGGAAGGHTAIHPQLGTPEDFCSFLEAARAQGLEVALDIAFQCSPDHPYVHEHPEWFRHRPDGTIQYAENPPKKYEDIYPFDFECENWRELWQELLHVVLHWVGQGVRIFRVDNPHTKSLRFWEWLIAEVKESHPDVLFLAEAFTRPKVMYHLAKLGFTQSYNYFPWRNEKWDLTEYFTELTQTPVREYFRANLWPNTPDILTEYLQHGGRAAFMTRAVLAATLGASYGIYGPAYELFENRPRQAGSEEYCDSEKYEIRSWNLLREDSLREFISRLNRIRRENPALHGDTSLRFHGSDSDQILCYSKVSRDRSNIMLMAVNVSPHHKHGGFVTLDLAALGLGHEESYQVHDLLTNARYLWTGPRNYVELDPHAVGAHVFRVRKRVSDEQHFEYFT
jgi:starch synthase (maltosyl-transferring)